MIFKKLKDQTKEELTREKERFFALSVTTFIIIATFLTVSLLTSSVLAVLAIIISPWIGFIGLIFAIFMVETKQELRLREYVELTKK